jgi:hypothetical protein
LVLLAASTAAHPTPGQELKQASPILAAKIAEAGKKRVAVVDFTDLQGNVTELGRFLAEEMSGALVNEAGGFRVVDRTHLKAILQEHKLAATGLIDPETARRLGKIAGVDTLVTGTIASAFGETVRVMIKALDVTTAEIIGQFTADIPKTEAIQRLLSQSIAMPPPAGSNDPAVPRPPAELTSAASSAHPSFETDSYRITVESTRRRESSVSLTLVFENLTETNIGLMWWGGTVYLLDENGERWNLDQVPQGAMWNMIHTFGGCTLLPGTKVRGTLGFSPAGQNSGTQFTLAATEGSPNDRRQVIIRGLK